MAETKGTELKTVGDGIEVWHKDKMVGKVIGSECCAGVKVVSNYPMMPKWHPNGVAEIRIGDEDVREREVEFPPQPVQLPLPLEP